jgi:SAM-dependent methyltransferase
MAGTGILKRFTDRTARRPEGKWARKNYGNPVWHRRSFEIILGELRLDESDAYCEVGCGGGILLRMAMAKAGSGAALDHSDAMVALARENNRDCIDAGRLEIVQGNAERLPWESGRFTACASANMFFFVENPGAMLSEAHRVLKPGGRFSMVTMGDGFLGKITFGWLYSLKTYSDADMKEMLRTAGFTCIKVKSLMGLMQVCHGERPKREGGEGR